MYVQFCTLILYQYQRIGNYLPLPRKSMFLLHEQVSTNWPQYSENGQQKSIPLKNMVTFHNERLYKTRLQMKT